jgi:hypothetical protein
MATGTYSQSRSAKASVETPPDVYIDRQLRRTQWQVRMLDIGAALVIWLVAVLASLLVFALIDHWVVALGTVGRWLALLALVGGSLYYFATQVGPLVWRRINSAYAAKVIEDAEPSLKNSLLNFLLLRKNPSGVSDLVVDALRQRAAADLSHAPIDHVVDRTPLIRLGYVLCGVMVVFALYKLVSPKDPFRTVARVLAPWAEIARPSRVRILKVQPGNSDVYRGQVVAISADLEGAREKDTVQLVYSTADGQTVDAVVPMTTAAGLHFTCQLPTGSGESEGIQQDITYRIKAGDAESPEYRLHVLPSPRMEVERVELHFPAYTKRPPQVLEKQGDLRAVEGTRAVIHGKANQEIESAFLEFDPTTPLDGRRRIPTLEMKSEGTTAVGEFVLERLADGTPWHSSYQLRFLSPTGMKNDRPTLHRIEVVADLSPEIEVLSPLERRVDLPVDRSLTVELRGRDPDFGLCRIGVELNKGEETLEPITLLENSEGQTGPANVRQVVVPQKLGLEPGDDLVLVGVAEDNRRDAAGNKSPNVSRTDRYTIHILPPEAAQRRPGEKSADEQPNGDKNEQRPPMRNQGGRDEKRPDENKSSKNKPDNKPNNDKQNPGDKNNDGEKSKGDDAAEGNNAEKTNSGEKKPGDKQGSNSKSGNNQKKQPGDKSEGGNEKNEDDSADQKQQKTEGQGGSGDKQQGKSSQQGDDNSSGSEGEGKSGSQNKNKGSGQSGSQSSGESSDEEGMSESGNEGSTGSKSSSKGSRQGKSGENASEREAGNEVGKSGEDESGLENADGSQGSEAKSGENAKQGRSGGQPAGEDASQQRPKHDGEAIEEVLNRMREEGKLGENNNSSKQSKSDNTQSGNENSNAGQKPNGSEQPQGSQQNPMSKGAQSGNQKQPGGEQGTAGEQQGGNEKTGSQNDKGQPGAKSEQQGSPMGDAGSQPGEKSNPGEKKPMEGDSPMDSSGDKANDQGKSKGGEKPGSPMNPGGEKPSENQTSENGGQGTQGDPGSGQKPEKPNPAGSSNTPSQDRQKNPQADGGKDNGSSPSPNSTDKKQSDSQGGESGEQRGGGKQGSGQSSKQEGNDAPGSSSSADDGAGASSEPGKGETGNKAGRDQKSDRTTGQSGNEKGPGSQSKPGEEGSQNNRQGSGKQDGGAGQQSQKGMKGDRNDPSKAGATDGAVTGGGLPSEGDVQSSGAPKREVADTEAERLEYAKKSTDMALKYLKDQKNDPDPELLKRLGWSKEDLDAFVRRWESMKSSAKEDTETRQDLDDAYRSLGLRPATDKRRSAGAGDDSARSLRDAGARSEPPSGYAEQFRAFRKGAGRK